jgi:hypothetical protein
MHEGTMSAIIKRIHPDHRRKRFWTPTLFESSIAILLAVLWLIAIALVIRHEQAGFFLSAAYVLLGLIGLAVSWLLLWPLLRILIHWTEQET